LPGLASRGVGAVDFYAALSLAWAVCK